jgi:hypothetical protein
VVNECKNNSKNAILCIFCFLGYFIRKKIDYNPDANINESPTKSHFFKADALSIF